MSRTCLLQNVWRNESKNDESWWALFLVFFMATETGAMLGVPWPNMHTYVPVVVVSHIVFFYRWWTEARPNMAMKPLLNIGRSSKWECSGGTQFHFSVHEHCKTRWQLPSNWVGTSEYFASCFIQRQPHHEHTKTDSEADSEGEWTGPEFSNSEITNLGTITE